MIALKRRQNNEEQLERELNRFFNRLKKEVLKALEEYWSDYQLLQGQVDLICSPVHEAHKEYYEILEKYIKREYKLGQAEAKRLVQRAKGKHAHKSTIKMPLSGVIRNDNNLFGTLRGAEDDLLNRTYRTSEQTLSRVDGQINQIITDGYKSGQGINSIAGDLTRRFDQLSTWEAKRIARTEVNTSHNKATVDTYNDLGVEYTQWIAANDDRTRDSHAEIDGEIIPLGGKYSNGLSYPGDMSGPIEEWINCRCSNAPFVVPYGYIAPSFSPFREEDLIPIENQQNPLEKLQEQQAEPTMQVPTNEQLKTNLTKQELEQVRWAKDVQTSEFISETGKAKARETLAKLYEKALGKPTTTTTTTTKPAKEPSKPKKEPVKPKPVNVNEVDNINRMTSNELYESMTKADKKKYDKFKRNYENGKKYNIPQIVEHNLSEMRKLEQKQRDKLRNKGKRKPKETPVRKYERDLDNIHNETEIPTKDLIPKLEKWIDKRCKNVAEFGYNFDIKTGKFIGGEIRGKKGQVQITDLGKGTGTIHSHPRNGMSVPSIPDLEGFRCQKGQHHFMVSEHEIWYVKATDSFGIGGMGQQLDLQNAHKACTDRAYDKVAKDIKKGKIEATEEAIAEALNKYTGDELLETFNSPPWNKTMTVKRYYR